MAAAAASGTILQKKSLSMIYLLLFFWNIKKNIYNKH